MPTIERIYDAVNDPRVYGNPIVSYAIDGVRGSDFSEVVAYASLKQSHAIESATTAFAKTVKLRQAKATALGEALATLTEALASMDPKSQDPARESGIDAGKLRNAKEILAYYGVCVLNLTSQGQVDYAEAIRRQNDVQTALDTENNDLQQAMTQLQGFLSRRDSAFKTASRIVRKHDETAINTIESIGA